MVETEPASGEMAEKNSFFGASVETLQCNVCTGCNDCSGCAALVETLHCNVSTVLFNINMP
ncbi:hypothetical protein JCM14076_16300 [Methylosoma difficile]